MPASRLTIRNAAPDAQEAIRYKFQPSDLTALWCIRRMRQLGRTRPVRIAAKRSRLIAGAHEVKPADASAARAASGSDHSAMT